MYLVANHFSVWAVCLVSLSLWRIVFASFETCPIKFTGRSHRQSVIRRHLPTLPTILGHMLPAALGPRRAKVSCGFLFFCLTVEVCWSRVSFCCGAASPVLYALFIWWWWWWWCSGGCSGGLGIGDWVLSSENSTYPRPSPPFLLCISRVYLFFCAFLLVCPWLYWHLCPAFFSFDFSSLLATLGDTLEDEWFSRGEWNLLSRLPTSNLHVLVLASLVISLPNPSFLVDACREISVEEDLSSSELVVLGMPFLGSRPCFQDSG